MRHTLVSIAVTRFFLSAMALVLLAATATVAAEPFRPQSDGEVLERLPERGDPALKELKRLRAALAARPGNLDLAVAFARRSIEAARSSGDPRYLGQAQAALQPWWTQADPPLSALLLRATIRQSTHDFTGALQDLDRLLLRAPRDGQALLTRATVRTVQGNYTGALEDCARVAPLTIPLVAAACAAGPESLSGHADRAYQQIIAALDGPNSADAGLRSWALTLAAEIAERRGDIGAAERHFREALALDPRDPYLLGAYSDFLLDRGRPGEVLPLTSPYVVNDSLLLRLALAEQRLPEAQASFARHKAELTDRFEAAHRRGDALHRREESRFRLAIAADAQGALRLARENWAVQREPADLRILAQAARAAGAPETLGVVNDWIRQHRLEDAVLAAIVGAG